MLVSLRNIKRINDELLNQRVIIKYRKAKSNRYSFH